MNLVEIVVRAKDETSGALEKHQGIMNTLKASALGLAGALGGSGGLGVAGALGIAGVALGAFAAVAKPELSKVEQALQKTGKAGQTAWKQLDPAERQLGSSVKNVESSFEKLQARLSPVVDRVGALAAKTAGDLMPALGKMASAGGRVIGDFLKPFDAFARSQAFASLVSQMAAIARTVGSVLGPAMVQLTAQFLRLFVQVAPSGIAILRALLPAISQLFAVMAPGIVILAKLAAAILTWLQHNHLLVASLIITAAAIALVTGASGILGIIAAIVAVTAAIGFFSQHWRQIWHDILVVVDAAIGFIKAHWQLILGILTGPIGAAVIFIISHWRTVVSFFSSAVGMIRSAWNAVYNAIVSPILSAYHTVVGIVNNIKGALSGIGSAVNSALGGIPGKVLNFLGLAHGGVVGAASGMVRNGMTLVGEHGPELVNLPSGAYVHSNPDTQRIMSGSGQPLIVELKLTSDKSALGEAIIQSIRPIVRQRFNGNVQLALGYY